MNISINILEVASELADLKVHEVFENNGLKSHVLDTENDCYIYTELGQDVFNEWYDYYYEFLESMQE